MSLGKSRLEGISRRKDSDDFSRVKAAGAEEEDFTEEAYMMEPKFAKEAVKHYVPLRNKHFDAEKRKLIKRYLEYELERNDKLKETHTIMAGGKLHIPLEKEEDFYKIYADVVQNGDDVHVVEIRTHIFRFFIDLDFKQLVGLNGKQIHDVARVAQKTMRRFFPSSDLLCIVSSNDYEHKPGKLVEGKTTPDMVKTGAHIIWTHVYVTKEQALDILMSIKADLEFEFSRRDNPDIYNSWDEVCDDKVYNEGSGSLRMMFSRKIGECGECKINSKKRKRGDTDIPSACSNCNNFYGSGTIYTKTDTGRPYRPLCVVDSHGNRQLEKENEYRKNMVQLLLDSKLRSDKTESNQDFTIPPGAPRAESKRKKSGHIQPGGQGSKSMTSSDPKISAIETFLRTIAPYNEITARNVKISKDSYIVYVKGYNSKYCQNVKREHKSNNIYFILRKEGVVQRCCDGDEAEDAMFGSCKEYSSAPMPLPMKLRDQLFKSKVEYESTCEDKNSRHRELKKIYRAIDIMSEYLFKTTWSTTCLGISEGEKIIKIGDEYTKINPLALGPKHDVPINKDSFIDTSSVSLDELQGELFKNLEVITGTALA